MAAESLFIEYPILDEHIMLYSKTGIYQKNPEKYGDDRIVPESDQEEWFTASGYERYVHAEFGEKLSIGLFEEKGGMFIIYNHDKDMYRVFPEAVDDLYYRLNIDKYRFFQRIRKNYQLKQAVKSFKDSPIINQVLNRFKNNN